MERNSGVLMPIFSLPSKYGIGSFGRESYEFVDYLVGAGQKLWQILPLVQTGFGNSPYSSVYSKSFNPYYIDIEQLKEEGLISDTELEFNILNDERVDYGRLYSVRYPLLREAFKRFDKNDAEFKAFVKSKTYYDYAVFMAIKYASGQKNFYEWKDNLKFRDKRAIQEFSSCYSDEILFWQFVQFKARSQWLKLKDYANSKGIKIIGDMPLYVAGDSVDVWVNPKLFKLDQTLKPKKIAGVPPDYFCEEGQLWGNPVYDYKEHEKNNFCWWKNRLKDALEVYDYVRIDHFRGFDRYYEVDAGSENAKLGEWIDVPSEELFKKVHRVIDKKRIIAEDLGIIDEGVRELLKKVGYPGMKILSFAFNGEKNNLYLPENIENNSICYTGTHDNDTLKGLVENSSEWDKTNLYNGVKNSLKLLGIEREVNSDEQLIESIIELGFASKASIFILPFADIVGKGSEYRINEPGTCKEQNWSVRFLKDDFNEYTQKAILSQTKKYSR